MNDSDLYPYQVIGRDFLSDRKLAYLADEPGMGKTIQAIRALVKNKAKRPLVVCPASAVGLWKAEWKIWGNPKVKLSVISYSKLVGDEKYRRAIILLKPSHLILDEGHYLKNKSAQRTAWIIGTGHNVSLTDMPMLEAVWLLSGTPYPNTQYELHHTLRQLWPELLREEKIWRSDAWLNMFEWFPGFKPESPPNIIGMKPEAVPKLQRVLDKMMLERTMESVGYELPDLDIRITPLSPTAEFEEQLAVCDPRAEEHVSTARRLLGEYKAPIYADIVAEELDANHYDKIVIFAYHTKTLNYLQKALGNFGLVRLDGSTSESDRTEAVELFQGDPKIRIFLGQQTAGGIAITLTAAARVDLVEPSWVPDDNLQAIKRVHRIGQDQHVLARLFTVGGTLDDSIMRVNHRKTEVKAQLKLS